MKIIEAILGFWVALFWIAPAQAELRVIDGDTLVLNGERIRIAYLDCPEMGQKGGQEAKIALSRLLRGEITLKPRSQPSASGFRNCVRIGYCDHYGRTVATVYANGARMWRAG